MNEPRGCPAMCMIMCINLVLPSCDPPADTGLIIMESDEYPPPSRAVTGSPTSSSCFSTLQILSQQGFAWEINGIASEP